MLVQDMKIYLLRHGHAEKVSNRFSEEKRPLSIKGRRVLNHIAPAVAELLGLPSKIISSPLMRALQTAEIIAQALPAKRRIETSDMLLPNASVSKCWDCLITSIAAKKILLVGHEPFLSSFAGFLLGAGRSCLEFKKGGLCRLEVEGSSKTPEAVLKWYLTPQQLLKLADAS